MRTCPGAPCADGTRAYRPIVPGTPVGVGERHRRLPADVPSPPSAVVLEVVDGFQLERVERTANGLQSLERHAKIAGGGPNIGMPQQNLNGAEVGASIEHVRGACVPKQVRMNQTWQVGPSPR